MFVGTWWSLMPPIVAIALALLTKEVYLSLFAGCALGALLTAEFHPWIAFDTLFNTMIDSVDFSILMFMILLGMIVMLMQESGGTRAYGEWASSHLKSKRSALVTTSLLGALIFVDDYFNCLTVGSVMRPVTDKYKVSRAKLAYIIDATAAPVCIIAPISSWAAAVGSSLKDTGVFESELGAFVATIPWNFYAIFSLLLVFFLCCTDFDFGPMRRAEEQASRQSVDATASGGTSDDKLKYNPNGTTWDMLVPLGALIVFAVMALMYTGGYWGADAKYHTFMAAIGNSSASISLVFASFGALIVALLMYVPRKLMTFAQFAEGSVEGMKLMLPANIILILAWTLSGVCRDLLSAPQFMQHVVTSSGMGAMFLPVIVFAIAAFLAFSMGTAWGTFGILIPIVVPIVEVLDPSLTVVVLSATLAGSVFGDHCSPISDTTILSSAGAGCAHIEHVSTQLPYALLVAGSAGVGYLVAGVSGGSLWMSWLATAVVLFGATIFLHVKEGRSAAKA